MIAINIGFGAPWYVRASEWTRADDAGFRQKRQVAPG